MEISTPKCRMELEDGTLLWEVNDLPKFWTPQKDDEIVFEGVEYEVKDILFEFSIQEGRSDPSPGARTPDQLVTTQAITVALKV